MLDLLDLNMEVLKDTLRIKDDCTFESDMKPTEVQGRFEYAAYLIRGDEVFKHVIAELSPRYMREFVDSEEFPRHLRQCMDKLAVKAGYVATIINNDKINKEVESV